MPSKCNFCDKTRETSPCSDCIPTLQWIQEAHAMGNFPPLRFRHGDRHDTGRADPTELDERRARVAAMTDRAALGLPLFPEVPRERYHPARSPTLRHPTI